MAAKVSAEAKPSEQGKPAAPETKPSAPSPESSDSKKKPAGAVSLFGGIDVLSSKKVKSPLDEDDDDFLSKSSPPPNIKKEEKVKKSIVSLFDDEEEEDESDWSEPIITHSKPTAKNTLKVGRTTSWSRFGGLLSLGTITCLWALCFFSSLQRSDHRPRAQACFRTRSCCSVRRSRRTTTQMWTSLPPQGKLQSVY